MFGWSLLLRAVLDWSVLLARSSSPRLLLGWQVAATQYKFALVFVLFNNIARQVYIP